MVKYFTQREKANILLNYYHYQKNFHQISKENNYNLSELIELYNKELSTIPFYYWDSKNNIGYVYNEIK